MYDGLKQVLVIEDDIDYRNSLSGYLSGHGMVVAVAGDGAMAMEKILFYNPELVILDLLLPKVKGMDVLKRIREYPDEKVKNILVIVLSNLSNPKDIDEAKALGVETYLVKSQYTFDEILAVVQEKLFKGNPPPNYEIVDFSQPIPQA